MVAEQSVLRPVNMFIYNTHFVRDRCVYDSFSDLVPCTDMLLFAYNLHVCFCVLDIDASKSATNSECDAYGVVKKRKHTSIKQWKYSKTHHKHIIICGVCTAAPALRILVLNCTMGHLFASGPGHWKNIFY